MNLGRIKSIHGREYDYETRLSRERELLSRSLIPQTYGLLFGVSKSPATMVNLPWRLDIALIAQNPPFQ